MADRINAPAFGPKAQLSPAARLVNTMQLPSEPQKSSLHELVGALEKVNPVLQRWAVKEQAKLDESELARGQVEFAKNRTSWKKAVEKGIVPEGANPHFRRGWRLTELQNQGRDYGFALRQAYESSPARSSDNPEELQQFTDKFTQEWLTKNVGDANDDVEVAEALLPQVKAQQNIIYQRHTEDRVHAADSGYQEQLTQGWSGVLETSGAAAVFDPMGTASQLQVSYDEAFKNGMNPAKLGKLMTDAVVAHAVEYGDTDILTSLDNIKHGSGPLGKTSYAKEQVAQAKRTIADRQRNEERFANYKLDNVRDETERQLTSSALDKMHSGNFDISEELGMAARVAPKAYKEMMNYRDMLLTNGTKVYEQPAVLSQLYEQIADHPEAAQRIIMSYASQGLINPASVEQAHAHARRMQEEGSMKDPIVKKVLGNLQQMISKSEEGGTPEDQFSLSTQASVHFSQYMSDFAAEYKSKNKGSNPSASLLQEKALEKYQAMTAPGSMWMSPGATQKTADPQPKPSTTGASPKQAAKTNPFDKFD